MNGYVKQKCPVCDSIFKNGIIICDKCGYDMSTNYVAFPTLQLIPENSVSVSKLRIKHNEDDESKKEHLEYKKMKAQIKKLEKTNADLQERLRKEEDINWELRRKYDTLENDYIKLSRELEKIKNTEDNLIEKSNDNSRKSGKITDTKKANVIASAINTNTKEHEENVNVNPIMEKISKSKTSFIYANGDKYVGQMYEGMRYGQGIMHYANGEIYNGSWEDDMKCGHGTYTYKDGIMLEAEWKNDSPVGEGIFILPNGIKKTYQFKNK